MYLESNYMSLISILIVEFWWCLVWGGPCEMERDAVVKEG